MRWHQGTMKIVNKTGDLGISSSGSLCLYVFNTWSQPCIDIEKYSVCTEDAYIQTLKQNFSQTQTDLRTCPTVEEIIELYK